MFRNEKNRCVSPSAILINKGNNDFHDRLDACINNRDLNTNGISSYIYRKPRSHQGNADNCIKQFLNNYYII